MIEGGLQGAELAEQSSTFCESLRTISGGDAFDARISIETTTAQSPIAAWRFIWSPTLSPIRCSARACTVLGACVFGCRMDTLRCFRSRNAEKTKRERILPSTSAMQTDK